MLRQILQYALLFGFIPLAACKSEVKYYFTLQTEDGKNLTKDTKIYYLGVEVGKVNDVHFGKLGGKDYVFADFEIRDKSILNSDSYALWSQNGTLEIINQETGKTLIEYDTLLLKPLDTGVNNVQSSEIIIKPLSNDNILNNKEVENLTPEEKQKLDSLQMKIKKLNNLIQEVNDEN